MLAQRGAEKSGTEFIVREKEKWTNKETVRQYVADNLIHTRTCLFLSVVPSFKILSRVREKSLTNKKLTHTQTDTHRHCYRNGKHFITLYALYTGGIIIIRPRTNFAVQMDTTLQRGKNDMVLNYQISYSYSSCCLCLY